MVFARNAVHSALWLVLTMLCLGVLYMVQAGAVPRLRADHRLHRRDHDAVPVRADAGRPGQLRLGRSRCCAASGSRRCVLGVGLRGLLVGAVWAGRCTDVTAGRAGRGRRERGRQRQGIGRADLHQVPVRLRAHLGAADHRGARGDGAGPRADAAAHAKRGQRATVGRGCAAGTTASRPLPGPGVFATGELGGRARRCCPTARSPRVDRGASSTDPDAEPRGRRRPQPAADDARARPAGAVPDRTGRQRSEPHLLPGALRAAVHHRRGRRAGPAQRDRRCSCASS